MVNTTLKDRDVANLKIKERQQGVLSLNQLLFREYLNRLLSVSKEYIHIHRDSE